MIFTIPLTLIFFLLTTVIGWLPDSSGLPSEVSAGFSWLWGLLWELDFVVPVSTVATLLGLSLAFEVAIQVWHGIHWLIRKIPMINIK